MAHIAKLIERRLPGHAGRIAPAMALVAALGVLVGIGLLLM